ncbi:MAG TPA: hypothetical protein VF192_10655 [Longimicrobiales bacterium]
MVTRRPPAPRAATRARPGWSAHDPLRRLLLAILAIGMIGLAAELVLLEHTEERVQFVPFAALGLGLISTVLVAVRPGRGTLRWFAGVMAACVLAGLLGLVMHYRGNVEFELEMHPELDGLALFWEAMRGATPALAPGALSQLGLLGLAVIYRHPLLRRPAREPSEEVRS